MGRNRLGDGHMAERDSQMLPVAAREIPEREENRDFKLIQIKFRMDRYDDNIPFATTQVAETSAISWL